VETINTLRRETLYRLGWILGGATLGQGIIGCKEEDKQPPQPSPTKPQALLEWVNMPSVFPYTTGFVFTWRWTAKEIDTLSLLYKKEGQPDFTLIAEVSAADGSFNWVINDALQNVKLKISSVEDKIEKEWDVYFQRVIGEVIHIADYPSLQQVGGVNIVSNTVTGDVFIRRKTIVEFIVVSAGCTHAGCLVEDNPGQGIICNCHGSKFNENGQVTEGPAMFDLQRFQSTFYPEQNKLIVVP
jgi:Rieske Fe-S protein